MKQGIKIWNGTIKWDSVYKCFVQFASPQVVKDYINFIEYHQDISPISFRDFSEKFDKNNEIEGLCDQLDISIYELSKWMLKQIDNFNKGLLPTSNIEKLKMIGFFEDAERFNDDDLKTIEYYFKNVDDTRILEDDIKNGDWNLKIAKYFVMNYYYRKPNQSHELGDYINEIIVNTINYANKNKKIDIPTLKRFILDKIKEFNEKNMNNEIDYLDEKKDSYNNINNLMSSIENNEMLTYNLIYLSVTSPMIYQTFCDYCEIKLVNNKIISTSNNFKSLVEVASNRDYSNSKIKSHIKIASNILKCDNSVLGKKIMLQEDYIIILLKSFFLAYHIAYTNKDNYLIKIIDLFNDKIYDDSLIKHIRTLLNESNDNTLLQYKDIIERKLLEIEKKYYKKNNNQINQELISDKNNDRNIKLEEIVYNNQNNESYESDNFNGKRI